jgi:hypothetical protein
MVAVKRPSRAQGVWPQGGAVVPGWLFWIAVVAVALASGLAIGYLGNSGNVVAVGVERSEPVDKASSTEATESATHPATGSGIDDPVADGPRHRGTDGAAEGLVTEGVTVQVLNASGKRRADNRVVDDLRHLGFRIVAVNPAAKIYPKTTVFWSKPTGRGASRALASHFSWRSAPRPKNLSKSVTTHVVVGKDET